MIKQIIVLCGCVLLASSSHKHPKFKYVEMQPTFDRGFSSDLDEDLDRSESAQFGYGGFKGRSGFGSFGNIGNLGSLAKGGGFYRGGLGSLGRGLGGGYRGFGSFGSLGGLGVGLGGLGGLGGRHNGLGRLF